MASIFVPRDAAALQRPLHEILVLQERIKIVDIGANPIDGDPPYAPLLANGRAELLGFEPNADALLELQARKGPHETYLPNAVGDGGRHELRLCALSGMTSLLEPNQAVLSLFDGFPEWAAVVARQPVDTVRLDDLPQSEGMDYLKIDIQGGELMVFQNAPDRLSKALVIHTEVEFLPMYHGQPLFAEIDQFLRFRGFMIHRLEPIVTRDFAPVIFGNDPYSGHSQLFWADAIYIRDITRLSAFADNELLKLAIILHDCYRSFDAVFYLLREHGRRTGSHFADTYGQMIVAAAKAAA